MAETPIETARRVWPGEWELRGRTLHRALSEPETASVWADFRLEVRVDDDSAHASLVVNRRWHELVEQHEPVELERLLIDARQALAAWLSPMVAAVQAVEPTDPAVMELPPPLPIGPEVWPQLLARVAQGSDLHRSMQARQELGLRRYGQTLHRDDGRPSYVDALQETLDLLVYLERDLMREKAREVLQPGVVQMLNAAVIRGLALAEDLRQECGVVDAD